VKACEEQPSVQIRKPLEFDPMLDTGPHCHPTTPAQPCVQYPAAAVSTAQGREMTTAGGGPG